MNKKQLSKCALNNNGICLPTSSHTVIVLPKKYFMEGKCNERFQITIGEHAGLALQICITGHSDFLSIMP